MRAPPSAFLVLLAPLMLLGACSSSTPSPGTGGMGGAPSGGCTCAANQRCVTYENMTTCSQDTVCVACQTRSFCGDDTMIYPSDCAAAAAGHAGPGVCTPPAGTAQCGSWFCDLKTENCTGDGMGSVHCVPCSTMGRVCGADGKAYDSECALFAAGQSYGQSCPGFVACGGTACDQSVAHCIMTTFSDCGGGGPAEVCSPGDGG